MIAGGQTRGGQQTEASLLAHTRAVDEHRRLQAKARQRLLSERAGVKEAMAKIIASPR